MSLVQEKGPAHKLMAACAAKLQQKDNIFEILLWPHASIAAVRTLTLDTDTYCSAQLQL